jgi:hypothetical protein
MITCGWCNTHYTSWQSQCTSCGGPMPPLPGMELGPPPPTTPRVLPKGFALRTRLTGNVATWVGLIFFTFGSLMAIAIFFASPWATLFPLFFALGGFGMLRLGLTQASNTLKAFKHGTAVAGHVHSVGLDSSNRINDEYARKLIYHFQVENQLHEGTLSSFDSTLSTRRSGQPLWVLYLPDDPTKNTLYPPIR